MVGRMKVARIASAVCILLLQANRSTSQSADVEGRYVWPLDDNKTVSSGFCDYRTNHYHGGIDFSTDGSEGLPVRAADSGWVMRVTTSYWGYGKAVYLQMTDGRMAVYGHLSEFSDAIQEYVENNQYSSRRYQQNLWPRAGELPVRRGEVIGKTGQTGAGPPHLHFELRTGDNRPLNPLVFAYDKRDTRAPNIREITIVPVQPADAGWPPSTIDGRLSPVTYTVSQTKDGWGITGKPRISGLAGVSIQTNDAVDSPRYHISTYRCRVLVNGELIADVRHDSINYDDTRLIHLGREFNGQPGYTERAIQMFRLPGNRLWHYATLKNDGWLELGETVIAGSNAIRIEAEDAAGNTSAVDFEITVLGEDAFDSGEEPSSDTPLPVRVEWSSGGLILFFNPSPQAPVLGWGDRGSGVQRAIPTRDGGWQFWLPPSLAVSGLGDDHPLLKYVGDQGYQAVDALDGGSLTTDEGRAQVRFAPGDLYYSSFFALRKSRGVAGRRKAVSEVYELRPVNVPFAHAARVAIRTDDPAAAARTGLYRYRENRKDWSYVGADYDPATGQIGGDIDYPGVFALLVDGTDPVIRDVTPGRGETTRNRRPWIRFIMQDDLSGIGSDADVVLTIDGDWVPVEYDPDTLQAKARPRRPLSPGEHRVEISVKDRAGNETTFLRILNIAG